MSNNHAMLIWSGWGILIPVIAIIGTIGATFIRVALSFTGYDFGFGVNVIGAAVAVFLFGKFIDRKPDAEGRKRANSLFFVPPIGWAVLLALVSVYSFYEESVSNPGFKKDATSVAAPSKRSGALEAAEAKIMSAREGVAHGNTAKARQCAELFSKSAKVFRDAGIDSADGKSLSLTGGEMVTYCEINGDRIAFLVHVPKLRKFNDDAKAFMLEASWAAAQMAASTVDPRPTEIAIGVRGVLLYEAAWRGTLIDDAEKGDFMAAVDMRVTDQDAASLLLRPFFRRQSKKSETQDDADASPATKAPAEIPTDTPKRDANIPSSEDALTLPTPMREWVATDGTTFTGSLVSFLDEDFQKAAFVNDADKTFRVPTSRFADEDVALLRKYFDSRSPN